MKFVVVNGRSPRLQSTCTQCRKEIGDSYLRDIATRLSYCTHKCYAGRRKSAISAIRFQARAS
jgi:hypothetical protein